MVEGEAGRKVRGEVFLPQRALMKNPRVGRSSKRHTASYARPREGKPRPSKIGFDSFPGGG